MSHQQNHLAKTKKNIFDKSIAQLLEELAVAKEALACAIIELRAGRDLALLLLHLENTFDQLEEMKQKRG